MKKEGYVVLHYNGNVKFVPDKGYNLASKSIVNCNPQDLSKKVIKTDSEGMLFGITVKGNAVTFPVSALGEDKWKSRGMSVNKFAKVDSDDVFVQIFDEKEVKDKKMLIVTRMGMAKYVDLEEFTFDKKSLTTAMTFKDEDDRIAAVELVTPPQVDDGTREARGYILSVTQNGMALVSYDDIPTQGRKAGGVKLMRFDDDDSLLFATHTDGNGEIISVLDSGFAKRVILGTIEPRMRMAKGNKIFDTKAGECVFIDVVTEPYDFAVVLPNGEVKSVNTEQIGIEDRANKGKNIIKIVSKDKNILTIGDCKRHNIID